MNTDCCAYIRLLYLLKRDEKRCSTVCVVSLWFMKAECLVSEGHRDELIRNSWDVVSEGRSHCAMAICACFNRIVFAFLFLIHSLKNQHVFLFEYHNWAFIDSQVYLCSALHNTDSKRVHRRSRGTEWVSRNLLKPCQGINKNKTCMNVWYVFQGYWKTSKVFWWNMSQTCFLRIDTSVEDCWLFSAEHSWELLLCPLTHSGMSVWLTGAWRGWQKLSMETEHLLPGNRPVHLSYRNLVPLCVLCFILVN